MADIIIVDDEVKICTLLQEQLRDAGHEAVGFTSPAEALKKLEKKAPDILITDLRMEEMDEPDEAKEEALKKKYEMRAKDITRKVSEEMKRIMTNPQLAAILSDAIQNVRPK